MALCSWRHNANSILLRRGIWLRSDILLVPSCIRYASFGGEQNIIDLLAKQKYH